MKTVRVAQASLRHCLQRRVNVQLDAKLQLEALPNFSHPLSTTNPNRRFDWLLPENYPLSVHANYLAFTGWTSLQGISSSVLGGKLVIVSKYVIYIFVYMIN
jgi:hypothetical protein